jgi:hypothetical protein
MPHPVFSAQFSKQQSQLNLISQNILVYLRGPLTVAYLETWKGKRAAKNFDDRLKTYINCATNSNQKILTTFFLNMPSSRFSGKPKAGAFAHPTL